MNSTGVSKTSTENRHIMPAYFAKTKVRFCVSSHLRAAEENRPVREPGAQNAFMPTDTSQETKITTRMARHRQTFHGQSRAQIGESDAMRNALDVL